jgi:undecaprenyl-diphosphatase
MHGVDVSLFHWINRWPESLAPMFVFLSEGIKHAPMRIGLAVFIVAMLARGTKTRKTVLLALVAWPLANFSTDLLKNIFKMPRPCVELPDAVLRVHKLTSFGTASAHSANMAAVATVLTYYLWPWGGLWIPIALLTGLSRIYVGVHYPSQVIGGWLTGILWGLVVIKTWESVQARRRPVTTDKDVDSAAETA